MGGKNLQRMFSEFGFWFYYYAGVCPLTGSR